MEDTYDIHDDLYCPKCRHSPLHSRDCTNIFCEDGYIEDFVDDLEIPGTGYEVKCDECKGTGVEFWCPHCGANLSGNKALQKQFKELNDAEDYFYKMDELDGLNDIDNEE